MMNDYKEIVYIKKEIKEQKILYQPQPKGTLVIQTDASDIHWAGILFAILPKHPHSNLVSEPGSRAKINQLDHEICACCSEKFKEPEKMLHMIKNY